MSQFTCRQCGKRFSKTKPTQQRVFCSIWCTRRFGAAKSVEECFWAQVDRSANDADCWQWLGPKLPSGYGVISKGKIRYAHRLALRLSGVDVPVDNDVCHKCDNPPCCNPSHLFVGTRKENMEDCAAKGRSTKGEKDAQALLRAEQVLQIREAAANGETHAAIAARYGIARRTVGKVASGVRWAHVGGPIIVQKPGRPRRAA